MCIYYTLYVQQSLEHVGCSDILATVNAATQQTVTSDGDDVEIMEILVQG